MTSFLNLSLWAMVLTLLSAGFSQNAIAQNLDPANFHATLDNGLDVTPMPQPKEFKLEESQPLSPWDTPSAHQNSHGLRYGTMIYRTENVKADLSVGLMQSWYLSPGWDIALAGDFIYPPAGQLETQLLKVFSRSILKPSAHIGLALQPNPKNGLAFLLDSDHSYFTAGLSMQDEWRDGRALKIELSGMAGVGGERRLRFLIYLLKVY